MSETPPAPRPPLFPYYPALDGLRGYFLIAVVLYHFSGTVLFGGALLTMSGFFVLSGFLIASLLIGEHLRDDRIRVGQFLFRRARRLLPASMLTIVVVAMLWNLFDLRSAGEIDPREVARQTNNDLLAATFYVLNWYTINGPTWGSFGGYAFSNPPEASPIAHFWSLAVEEQFYLVFPFVAVLSMGLLGGRRALAIVVGGGLLLSIALQPTLEGAEGIEVFLRMVRIYVGTDVRAAEFLLGSLMAVLFSYPTIRHWITTSKWMSIAGIIAFILMTYSLFEVRINSHWLYARGGFALVGVVFAVIIFALTQSGTLLVHLLDNSVLRWLGQRSYGMYVYHFTLMCLFDAYLVGWSAAPRIILLVIVTLIVGSLSYTYFEQPIRKGYWPRRNSRPKAVS